jgi:hypothetical protein
MIVTPLVVVSLVAKPIKVVPSLIDNCVGFETFKVAGEDETVPSDHIQIMPSRLFARES